MDVMRLSYFMLFIALFPQQSQEQGTCTSDNDSSYTFFNTHPNWESVSSGQVTSITITLFLSATLSTTAYVVPFVIDLRTSQPVASANATIAKPIYLATLFKVLPTTSTYATLDITKDNVMIQQGQTIGFYFNGVNACRIQTTAFLGEYYRSNPTAIGTTASYSHSLSAGFLFTYTVEPAPTPIATVFGSLFWMSSCYSGVADTDASYTIASNGPEWVSTIDGQVTSFTIYIKTAGSTPSLTPYVVDLATSAIVAQGASIALSSLSPAPTIPGPVTATLSTPLPISVGQTFGLYFNSLNACQQSNGGRMSVSGVASPSSVLSVDAATLGVQMTYSVDPVVVTPSAGGTVYGLSLSSCALGTNTNSGTTVFNTYYLWTSRSYGIITSFSIYLMNTPVVTSSSYLTPYVVDLATSVVVATLPSIQILSMIPTPTLPGVVTFNISATPLYITSGQTLAFYFNVLSPCQAAATYSGTKYYSGTPSLGTQVGTISSGAMQYSYTVFPPPTPSTTVFGSKRDMSSCTSGVSETSNGYTVAGNGGAWISSFQGEVTSFTAYIQTYVTSPYSVIPYVIDIASNSVVAQGASITVVGASPGPVTATLQSPLPIAPGQVLGLYLSGLSVCRESSAGLMSLSGKSYLAVAVPPSVPSSSTTQGMQYKYTVQPASNVLASTVSYGTLDNVFIVPASSSQAPFSSSISVSSSVATSSSLSASSSVGVSSSVATSSSLSGSSSVGVSSSVATSSSLSGSSSVGVSSSVATSSSLSGSSSDGGFHFISSSSYSASSSIGGSSSEISSFPFSSSVMPSSSSAPFSSSVSASSSGLPSSSSGPSIASYTCLSKFSSSVPDMSSSRVSSADDCAALCSETPLCYGFVFLNLTTMANCYLKKSMQYDVIDQNAFACVNGAVVTSTSSNSAETGGFVFVTLSK